jgi:phage/plasmid-like protein (TIGR03299 family)
MLPDGLIGEDGRSFYGRSNVVEKGISTEAALKAADLDFTVVSRPIYDELGHPIKGYRRNVREDTGHLFGITTDEYKIIQNGAAFEICDLVSGENGAEWVAGGMTPNRMGYVWGLMKTPEDFLIAGDRIGRFMLFVNSHRGDASFTVANLANRFACTNALQWSVSNALRRIKIRHTGDTNRKMQDAHRAVVTLDEYFMSMRQLGDHLALQQVSGRRLAAWLEHLYPAGTTDTTAKNAADKREVVKRLVHEAPNLDGHHDTAWGFVNAVAEVADWGSSRERSDRMGRLIGDADTKLKQTALKIVCDSYGIKLTPKKDAAPSAK